MVFEPSFSSDLTKATVKAPQLLKCLGFFRAVLTLEDRLYARIELTERSFFFYGVYSPRCPLAGLQQT